jgi:hypothetical protein
VLTVLADPHEVRIVDGATVLGWHVRRYDKSLPLRRRGTRRSSTPRMSRPWSSRSMPRTATVPRIAWRKR